MHEQITKLEARVKELLSGETTGHDWYHIDHVRNMALRIAEKEGGNKELIEMAALAHEIGDRKFYPNKADGEAATKKVLEEVDIPQATVQQVLDIIRTVSFSGGGVPTTLEGKIVQDADRLYALGAIGIARTFAYGGRKERPIYDPAVPVVTHKTIDQYDQAPTINHFYEKLLLLKDKIHTDAAKKVAEKRHKVMEDFLEQFYAEWEARD